jgi:hypothetical protein
MLPAEGIDHEDIEVEVQDSQRYDDEFDNKEFK